MEFSRGQKRKRPSPTSRYEPIYNDNSSNASSHSADEDDHDPASTKATTPLTPNSSRSTSRHPSDINKTHICTISGCSKAFNRPAKLEQHLRSHTNTRPFVCPHTPCAKDFLRDSHLKHHITSAHSYVRNHSCAWEGCNKRFLTSTRLKRHVAAHEGRENFTCTVSGCEQAFRKHATLQAHIAKLHEGKKPFVCAFLSDDGKRCKAGFDSASKLKDHEGRLHEIKRYTCSLCPPDGGAQSEKKGKTRQYAAFSTYSALQEHVASEHPPTCTVCGLRCASQANLKSHVEVVHGALDANQRRTHICSESGCGAGFTKKGNLNVHIRTIHGNQRYICSREVVADLIGLEAWDGADACGIPFTSKAHLIGHIKTTHLGLDTLPTGKPKKGKRSRKNEVSAIARLTGSGYAEESDRIIACLIIGCEWRFNRDHDHELHLRSHHDLADLDIQALRTEDQALEDLFAPSAFQELSSWAGTDNANAEDAFTERSENLHGSAYGGDFWIGGDEDDEAVPHNGNQWFNDEMEMRQLIHDDHEMVDINGDDSQVWMTVDPELLR